MTSLFHRALALSVAMLAILFAFAVASNAQDDTIVRAAPLVDFVLPIVLAVVGGVISIATAVLVPILVRKFSLQNEANIRDAIQTSLSNTASGVIRDLGVKARDLTVDVRNKTVKDFVQRAVDGAKDSFETAGLTQEEIASRVLEQVTKQLTAAGVVTGAPLPGVAQPIITHHSA